jgi:hypothetical protein
VSRKAVVLALLVVVAVFAVWRAVGAFVALPDDNSTTPAAATVESEPCATHGGVQVRSDPAMAQKNGHLVAVLVVGCADGTQESSDSDNPDTWTQVP